VKAAHDAGTWTRAALTCLGNLDDATAKTLATYLTERGADPAAAGKTAGGLLGRISVYLALVGPVFSAMNFALEQRLSDSARTVNVYPKVLASGSSRTFVLHRDGSLTDATGAKMPTSTYAALKAWLVKRLGQPTHQSSGSQICFGFADYHALWFGKTEIIWSSTSLNGESLADISSPGPVAGDMDAPTHPVGGPRIVLPGGLGIGATLQQVRDSGLTVRTSQNGPYSLTTVPGTGYHLGIVLTTDSDDVITGISTDGGCD